MESSTSFENQLIRRSASAHEAPCPNVGMHQVKDPTLCHASWTESLHPLPKLQGTTRHPFGSRKSGRKSGTTLSKEINGVGRMAWVEAEKVGFKTG